jgi:hypothetical protein
MYVCGMFEEIGTSNYVLHLVEATANCNTLHNRYSQHHFNSFTQNEPFYYVNKNSSPEPNNIS